MHKRAFFMCNICSKILANNNIPSFTKLLIKFFFDNTCNFAIFLSLKYIGHIGNFFNSCIGYTDDGGLIFWLKIRYFDKYLFVIFLLLIIILVILLLMIDIFLLILIFKMFWIKSLILRFTSYNLLIELWHEN